MSKDKDPAYSDGKVKTSDEGNSNISEVNPEKNIPKEIDEFRISKDKLPSFKKILVTDDGKDISNKALNYAVYLSNSTTAELFILRILPNVEKLGNISFEGSHKISQMNDQDFHRKIKGDVIDAMEQKIKKCKEAGCKNKVSYKFLTGNVVDGIVDEINSNDYDLVIMLSLHIDSWFKSLFSDAQKIIRHIKKPVFIIQ